MQSGILPSVLKRWWPTYPVAYICLALANVGADGGCSPVIGHSSHFGTHLGTQSPAFAFYAPAVLVDPALLGSIQARNSL